MCNSCTTLFYFLQLHSGTVNMLPWQAFSRTLFRQRVPWVSTGAWAPTFWKSFQPSALATWFMSIWKHHLGWPRAKTCFPCQRGLTFKGAIRHLFILRPKSLGTRISDLWDFLRFVEPSHSVNVSWWKSRKYTNKKCQGGGYWFWSSL